MTAIVDEAHSHGMKVAAHAHGLKGIRTAIKAGVDSIEHASFIDKDTIQLAIKNNANYLAFGAFSFSNTKKTKYKANLRLLKRIKKMTKKRNRLSLTVFNLKEIIRAI